MSFDAKENDIKNAVFDIQISQETGGISSLVMCGDAYTMNWCGHTKDWGVPTVMSTFKNRTFRDPLSLVSCTDAESVWENESLRVTLTRTFDTDGALVETYAFRQGASAQNLGLVVVQGAIDAYSIDREHQTIGTARRGNILLHPVLPTLRPQEETVLVWKIFRHCGTEDFFACLSAYGRNPDVRIEQDTVMGDEPFRFDFAATEASVTCDGKTVLTTQPYAPPARCAPYQYNGV